MAKKKNEKSEWDELLAALPDTGNELDRDTLELADAIRDFWQDVIAAHEEDTLNNEKELINVLLDDDYLLDELVDKLALVGLSERYEEGEITDEAREKIYMTFLDTFFELSKTINPLGGFDKGRLFAALDLLKDFEKRYFPVTTKITEDNAEVFKNMIPDEHYDDILAGRKYALGALRHLREECYAAGVIVYSILPADVLDSPMISIDWINVEEVFREKGVGNMLMASVIGLAAQNEESVVSVSLPIFMDKADPERDILENFLESWKFEFEMSTGENFVILIKDIEGNKDIDAPSRDAVSLHSLGKNGAKLVKEYFKRRNIYEENEIAALPYSFFDPFSSCAVISDGKIRSLFLLHRFESGDYRYEYIGCKDGFESHDFVDMLRFAYKAAVFVGDDNKAISGTFDCEEGYEALAEILPGAHVGLTLFGLLQPPEIELDNDTWDELRREAGLSDEKIPGEEDALDDETITDEDFKAINDLLTGENE